MAVNLLIQALRIRGIIKNDNKPKKQKQNWNKHNATNATVIIDHFMCRISIKDTINFDFGREA